jgi:hypothetical protein
VPIEVQVLVVVACALVALEIAIVNFRRA